MGPGRVGVQAVAFVECRIGIEFALEIHAEDAVGFGQLADALVEEQGALGETEVVADGLGLGG